MKVKIMTIALGLTFAVSAARGVPFEGLNIQEINENLVPTFNGGPASFVTITPTLPNTWTITLSAGWTLAVPIDDVELGEPEGGIGPNGMFLENFIHFDSETAILWQSEFETDVNKRSHLSEVADDALIKSDGTTFNIRFADVPESGFTLSLLGIGLAGLAWFAMCRRRAT